MNVLLFTHGIDIDGMGSAVLAHLFAQKLEIQFCETENIDEKFEEIVLKSKNIPWDYIFITDTCPGMKTLEIICENPILKNKVFVFDHHKNQLSRGKDRFPFVTLQLEDETGLCCGTSLFYKFLVKKHILTSWPSLDLFVEYTREYDTWEWMDQYHNEIPHEMTILYEYIGNDEYISEMKQMLMEKKETFEFSNLNKKIIQYEKKRIVKICSEKINMMIPIKIQGISGGVIFSEQYYNEFREYYEKNEVRKDCQFIMIVNLEMRKIFFRGIHKFVTTDLVLSQGGSGNPYTGSRNLTDEELKQCAEFLIKD